MDSKSRIVVDAIGMLAIAASLVFVGLQLRQDRIIALGNQYQTRAEISSANYRVFIESDNAVEDYVQWQSGEPISEAQLRRVRLMRTLGWLAYDNNHYQHSLGLIEDEVWNRQRESFKAELADPMFLEFVAEGRGRKDFIDLARTLIEERDIDE